MLVTGSHRSGSTWVGRTLAASPGIGYIHEPLSPLCPPGICRARFPRWYFKLTEANAGPYERALGDCIKFRYQWRAQAATIRSAREAAKMVRDGAVFLRRRMRGDAALVKDPIALFSTPWLARRFDMQVVVLVRHPAAFVGSLLAADWHFPFKDLVNQPALMEDELQEYQRPVTEFAERPRPLIEQGILLWNLFHDVIARWRDSRPGWIIVRHEDLSRDPVNEYAALCERLGLDFESGVRDAVQRFAFSSRDGHIARDSRSNIWSWCERLSPQQVEAVREGTRAVWPRFYSEEDWQPPG